MGRFRLFAGIALLVVSGLVVVSSYYLGGRVQRQFTEVFAEDADWANRAQVRSEIVAYNRGVFSSNATTRISPSGRDAPALLLRHNIRHGPFFARGDRFLGLARVDTVSELEHGNSTTPFRTAFQTKSPMRATTRVALGGSVHSRITSPKERWQGQDIEFAWGGMNATVNLLRGSEKGMELDFQLPLMETDVPGQTGDMLVSDVHASRSLRRNQQGGIINGSAAFRCSSFRVHGGEWGEVSAESVTMTSRTDRSEGLLRSETELGLKQGRLGDLEIRQGDFRMRLDNLDADALRQWQNLLKQPPEEISRKRINGIAKRFLGSSPRMEEAKLRLETEEGEIRLNATAVFDGSGELSSPKTPQMLQRLKAQSRFSVPVPVGVRMATASLGFVEGLVADQDSAPENEDLERRARGWLERLRKPGYISRDSGRYATSLKLEKGLLSVNDKPVLPLGVFLQGE
ncbi:MAG: YdgA family protein [Desulfohalobiaceae bacterium]|nr:YdgA family protein [Desulfohalobiaceae bacterium]